MKKHIPTIRDVVTSAYVTEVAVSPNGRQVAFAVRTVDWTGNRFVGIGHVHDTDSGNTREVAADVWALRWRTDRELAFLANVTAGDHARPQVHLLDLEDGTRRLVTSHPQGVSRFWLHGGHLIFHAAASVQHPTIPTRYVPVVFEGRQQREQELFFQPLGHPAAADTNSGGTAFLLTATLDGAFTQIMDLVVGGDRRLYCTCRKTPDWTDVAVFELPAAAVAALAAGNTSPGRLPSWKRLPIPENAGVWAVSPCGKNLLLNWDPVNPGGYSNEAPALWSVSTDDPGRPPRRLAPAFDGCFLGARWTQAQGIVVRSMDGTRIRMGVIAEGGEAPVALHTGDWSVLGMDVSPAGRVAAFVAAPDAQPRLATFDLGEPDPQMRGSTITHLPDRLSFAAADDERVQQWGWGRQEVIRWESDGGVTIEGVLYLPDEFSKDMRYPLLVIAHGGPGTAELAVRRDWEDCWLYPTYQMLGRGCVVLKPNYRGSDGYGRAFHDAPFASGGAVTLMLRDVEAGVRYLVQQGMVDPSRVGLAGWSAGGAISAYAAVHSTCFRAISAGAGFSDPLIYLASSCYPGWPVKVHGGFPWEAREAWLADAAAWSRIAKATPTLIQQGDDDPICTLANANALYLTLAKQGVPAVFARFPGHGHGVFNHGPRSAFTVMSQNLKWFSHHLLDAPLDWEAADNLEE